MVRFEGWCCTLKSELELAWWGIPRQDGSPLEVEGIIAQDEGRFCCIRIENAAVLCWPKWNYGAMSNTLRNVKELEKLTL